MAAGRLLLSLFQSGPGSATRGLGFAKLAPTAPWPVSSSACRQGKRGRPQPPDPIFWQQSHPNPLDGGAFPGEAAAAALVESAAAHPHTRGSDHMVLQEGREQHGPVVETGVGRGGRGGARRSSRGA